MRKSASSQGLSDPNGAGAPGTLAVQSSLGDGPGCQLGSGHEPRGSRSVPTSPMGSQHGQTHQPPYAAPADPAAALAALLQPAATAAVRPPRLRVAFCHPDLGLGGAERLVVDAAAELAARKHRVSVFTAYYNPQRSFAETRSGLFDVQVAGDWWPRNVFGRFHALCAFIRCCLCALFLAWVSRRACFDVVFVDQVSVVIPILKLLTRARVLFYCHFPDLLLAEHSSPLRRWYRYPLDRLEEATTGQADAVLVNSKFTAGVFASTFRKLHSRGVRPDVCYPAVRIPSLLHLQEMEAKWKGLLPAELADFVQDPTSAVRRPVFLSINRFERKKNVALAVEALQQLLDRHPESDAGLVLAGGYDSRLQENVQVLQELQAQVSEAGLADRVHMMPSFTDAQRDALLMACVGVVYTPENEHFGIVPLEAMAHQRPVIACNSGGPTESIVDGRTGYLCEPTAEAFAEAMSRMLNRGSTKSIGMAARQHVETSFSRAILGDSLESVLLGLARSRATLPDAHVVLQNSCHPAAGWTAAKVKKV